MRPRPARGPTARRSPRCRRPRRAPTTSSARQDRRGSRAAHPVEGIGPIEACLVDAGVGRFLPWRPSDAHALSPPVVGDPAGRRGARRCRSRRIRILRTRRLHARAAPKRRAGADRHDPRGRLGGGTRRHLGRRLQRRGGWQLAVRRALERDHLEAAAPRRAAGPHVDLVALRREGVRARRRLGGRIVAGRRPDDPTLGRRVLEERRDARDRGNGAHPDRRRWDERRRICGSSGSDGSTGRCKGSSCTARRPGGRRSRRRAGRPCSTMSPCCRRGSRWSPDGRSIPRASRRRCSRSGTGMPGRARRSLQLRSTTSSC